MLHESHHAIINSYHSRKDYGDDHLSTTKVDFISDTSYSMIVYNNDDDDVHNYNDCDYDINAL